MSMTKREANVLAIQAAEHAGDATVECPQCGAALPFDAPAHLPQWRRLGIIEAAVMEHLL